MALKKMSSSMKIITIIIAIAMLIPIFMQAYVFFANRETKTVMLKIEGEKIYKEDFDNSYSKLKEQLQQLDEKTIETGKLKKEEYKPLPEDIVKAYVLSNLVKEALNEALAKQLGVKVTSNDINVEYKKIEDQLGGSANLIAALQQQGQSLETLRANIKQYVKSQKEIDAIKAKIIVTDEDIENKYKKLKYTKYEDKSLAEVKEDVREEILNSLSSIYETSLSENLFKNAKVKVYDKEIQPIFDKLKENYYTYEGYELNLYDVISLYLNQFYTNSKGLTDDFENLFKENLKVGLERSIEIKDLALKEGLKLDENLLPRYQLIEIYNRYINKKLISYQASEEELKSLFEKYRPSFDIKHTISGDVLAKVYKVSEKDELDTKTYVEGLMKDINKDNFAQKATELSEDPGSAQQGGSLGKADITKFVKEFKDAVLNAKAGEIVGPVKTQFGFHIIYVEAKDESNPNIATLSHILISVKPGQETKDATKSEIDTIKNDLLEGKVKWDDIIQDSTGKYKDYQKESFSKLEITSQLPLIGYNKDINDTLFAMKVGEFLELPIEDAFVLIQKTDDIPYRQVTFEEIKDKLNFIAANNYVESILKK